MIKLLYSHDLGFRVFHLACTSVPGVFVTLSADRLSLDCWEAHNSYLEHRWSRTLEEAPEEERLFSVFRLGGRPSIGLCGTMGEVWILDLADGSELEDPFLSLLPKRETWGPIYVTNDSQWCFECHEGERFEYNERDTTTINLSDGTHSRLTTQFSSISEHPSGKLFAATSQIGGSEIHFFRVIAGVIEVLPISFWTDTKFFSLQFSPDGRWLGLTGGIPPRTVTLLDLSTLEEALMLNRSVQEIDWDALPDTAFHQSLGEGYTKEDQTPLCNDVAFSSDSELFFCPGETGGLDVYHLPTCEQSQTHLKNQGFVTAMGSIHQSSQLVTAHDSGRINVWQLPDTQNQRPDRDRYADQFLNVVEYKERERKKLTHYFE